ncbi:MAG TPA: Fe-S-containing hydro-lyase [Thermodesulforhabdus norvegica]|uniref:Fe-S-containing hydro-lyase n=1 Tax=Thermodesulforhabdus norvegica TaxID=39841 RepID=A0A7C1AMJ5_9BACT|nr:Fe-S-containing hydro-lyase [Deltaproteobacteria bacterium]MBW2069268.1 Fe-S-containing hydro-lyase [Deltaproteobacteria bacterium]HDL90627.1 Fe-S-containing hydro-lyase [Thermodesulforhabdus norvegica]
MKEPKKLTTPLTDDDVIALKIGDTVLLSGVIYSARDAAHRRLVELIKADKPLPFELQGQVIYYMGPSPAPPGRPIGAAGPTTSYRMDPYAPTLIAHGLKGMIGKGARNDAVKEAMQKHRAVYFAAIGGAGALMSKSILSAEVIAYPELGPEAIRRLEVKDMPLVVANDVHGGDLYVEGVKQYSRI